MSGSKSKKERKKRDPKNPLSLNLTIKLPYESSEGMYEFLLEKRKIISPIYRFAYNRFSEERSLEEVREIIKTKMNHRPVDSWELESILNTANWLWKATSALGNKAPIFGGKKNFFDKMNGKISKEEYQLRRLEKYTIIGEAPHSGNRKFSFDIENDTIIWKSDRKNRFELTIPKTRRGYYSKLLRIQKRMKNKEMPITIQLDDKFIYITYNPIEEKKYTEKDNGIFAGIDMNPNNIGLSIHKWNKKENKDEIIYTENFSLYSLTSKLNDVRKQRRKNNYLIRKRIKENPELKDILFTVSKYPQEENLENKIKFEIIEIAKKISQILGGFNCKHLFIEQLKIESKDNKKGKNYNRLVNNYWKRNQFVSSIKKYCHLRNIRVLEVLAYYTSLIGNLVYTQFPDPVAASCEIARRGYEVKILRRSGRFYLELASSLVGNVVWKNVIDSHGFCTWKDLSDYIKKSRLRYRIPWSLFEGQVLRKLASRKSLISYLTIPIVR